MHAVMLITDSCYLVLRDIGTSYLVGTNLCLHHEASPSPHVLDKLEDAGIPLSLYPQQLGLDGDEGPCSPYSCTAMDHQRPSIDRVTLRHLPYKMEERGGFIWYTMIRPDGEVELSYDSLTF